MKSESVPAAELLEAAQRHGIALEPEVAAELAKYCHLLWKWNARLNLTRHTDFEKFVTRDLVDTLAIAELLDVGEHVLDVGTGGGLPGIPLAILRPDLRVSLCESVGKKAQAVKNIVAELGLETPVFAARAEEVLGKHHFDTLVLRAVAPLAKILTWFQPHWSAFERILAIKGRTWTEERGEARHRGLLKGIELRRVAEYTRPGDDFPSVILRMRPEA